MVGEDGVKVGMHVYALIDESVCVNVDECVEGEMDAWLSVVECIAVY